MQQFTDFEFWLFGLNRFNPNFLFNCGLSLFNSNCQTATVHIRLDRVYFVISFQTIGLSRINAIFFQIFFLKIWVETFLFSA